MVIGIATQLLFFPLFLLFILEEAVQAASFGLWVAVQGKMWERAAAQIKLLEGLLDRADAATERVRKWLDALSVPPGRDLPFVPESLRDISAKIDLGADVLVLPFIEFFAASRSSVAQFKARVFSEMPELMPGYGEEAKALKERHEREWDEFAARKDLEKATLLFRRDAELDALRARKRKTLFNLKETRDKAKADAKARHKAGAITKSELNALIDNVEAEYFRAREDAKVMFDDEDRAVRARFADEFKELAKAHSDFKIELKERQKREALALRQRFFPEAEVPPEEAAPVAPAPVEVPPEEAAPEEGFGSVLITLINGVTGDFLSGTAEFVGPDSFTVSVEAKAGNRFPRTRPGTYEVTVRSGDFEPQTKTVDVVEGRVRDLRFVMQPPAAPTGLLSHETSVDGVNVVSVARYGLMREGHVVTAYWYMNDRLVLTRTVDIPPPSAEGHDWWNFYEVRFTASNIGYGDGRVVVTFDGNFSYSDEFTVRTGLEGRPVTVLDGRTLEQGADLQFDGDVWKSFSGETKDMSPWLHLMTLIGTSVEGFKIYYQTDADLIYVVFDEPEPNTWRYSVYFRSK
jgi:hypothetical protein